MSKRALGKGIDALLGGDQLAQASSVQEVAIRDLRQNPEQPRQAFRESSLKELADSIRQKGVLQPVLVEEDDDGSYVIVAGERRVRAARLAGLERVPVVIRQFTANEKLEIALIENVQREDLSPLEEARAYKRLMELGSLSQEQVAQKVGKDRSTVANTIRLLKLPGEVQAALEEGAISAGHARAILMLVNVADQAVLLRRMVDRGLSVRQAEEMASALNRGKKGDRSRSAPKPAERLPDIRELEGKLMERLGTKVEVKGTSRKGRIEISYFNDEDLERILQIIG
ncbi:MAG TPA: ParB/RepB/Spo0J family partition protein [Spirochaetia bacterium]|nr:ParB/RepB/Spo0J family partition protein [Spirochaetia bacterium]